MKRILFCILGAVATASAQTDGYRIETVPNPETDSFDVTGLDVDESGRVWCATRLGEVWWFEGGEWTKFAEGLHEPCGLIVEEGGSVLVSQKPEVTRLVDDDGDGIAERFVTAADEFGYHDNYHEFNHGLVRDSDGNVYGALNLDHGNPGSFKVGGLGSPGGLRGTAYRLSPGDDYSTYAWGMRSPAGLGMSPGDELFYTDNQGNWVPTSFLAHVPEGSFQAEPTSLRDHPDYGLEKVEAMTPEDFAALRTPPSVFFPHEQVSNSPGNAVWDTTGGAFGPFEGQVFVPELTQSNLLRVMLEKVDGHWQGAVTVFLRGFQSGNIRADFGPDGALWIGQTSRGWGARGGKPYGLQKVVWDGETTPFAVRGVRLLEDGFEVEFTRPVARDAFSPDALHVSSWWYHYHREYGSPKVDEREVPVESAELDETGRVARFRMPLEKERVYAFHWSGDLAAEDGEAAKLEPVFYTVIRLRR